MWYQLQLVSLNSVYIDQTQGSDEHHTQKLDHLFDQDVQFY